MLRKNLKKHFFDLFGDDSWINLSRSPFVRQVADVPTVA